MQTRIASYVHTATVMAVAGVLLFCSGPGRAADCTVLTITNELQSQTTVINCHVTFAVGLTGSGLYRYQWWRDGQPIPDGTNASYTSPVVSLADDGASFRVIVSNECSQVISSNAYLYIVLDVFQPTLLRARGDATLAGVLVSFAVGFCGSPGLDEGSAGEPTNYSFTGGLIVSNAVLDATGTNVLLTTSPQTPGTIYTLAVEYVTDRTGNVIPPDSSTRFQAWVPVPGSDPPAFAPPPVSIRRSGSTNYISWPPGSLLQEAVNISGPWNTRSGVLAPYEVVVPDGARYFRAVFQP